MSIVDLDYCELRVTVKNYFSSLPYIDASSGLTTMDMPYEAAEITDEMYEPKKHSLPTARVTFQSLVHRPELRPLLSLIKEGDRVEIYNFQPDCGDPVFAGYIPPGGIISDDTGHVILEITNSLGAAQWERLRRLEVFNTNAAGYFKRAMSKWHDLLNEDFNTTNDPNVKVAYSTAASLNPIITWANGSLKIQNDGIPLDVSTFSIQPLASASTFSLTPGTTLLFEVAATPFVFEDHSPGQIMNTSFGFINGDNGDTFAANEIFGTDTSKYNSLYGFYTNYAGAGSTFYPTGYNTPNFNMFPAPRPGGNQNAYQVMLVVNSDSTISMSFYVNYLLMVTQVLPAPRVATNWLPWLSNTQNSYLSSMTIARWRVRVLQPWIAQAARFNPQTSDATYFQANADDNLTFFNNFAELDFSEYRVNYKAAPAFDQIELDRVGTLGAAASSTLGMDLITRSIVTSPSAVGTEVASFTGDASSMAQPPFRFEEGYNLVKVPLVQKRNLNHANLIQRLGSGTLDAQNFYETWSVVETGKPQAYNAFINPAPIAPQFPYFEQVVNDDRTVLPATIQRLAANDLAVATDGVPSLTITAAEQLQFGFKYRAGDNARVITRNLLSNLDQDMRIASIKYKAGDPQREIIMGKLANDPSMVGPMAQDMVESWLYNQGGSSPLAIIYPNVGSIAANAYGTDFVFPIDQFTAGTSIVSASLHWYTGAGSAVSNIQVAVAGSIIDGVFVLGTLISTGASGQDSGLVNVTGLFNNTGNYHLNVKNISGAPIVLSGLFLILKIKVN